jgi:hypothetical protein|tara:strand:+ start:279 stop:617 length:339 start_codon:yes stop_codon:yes gene_type:complete
MAAPCFTKTINTILTLDYMQNISYISLLDMEVSMKKYKILIDDYTWDADTDEGFVDGLRKYHTTPSDDDAKMLRIMAAGWCDWTGEPMRFSSASDLIADAVKHGVLEVTDAV